MKIISELASIVNNAKCENLVIYCSKILESK